MGWGSDLALSHDVGCKCSSDPELLWRWCRQATAAPIQPLVWELPYVMGVALKRPKKKKEEEEGGLPNLPEKAVGSLRVSNHWRG